MKKIPAKILAISVVLMVALAVLIMSGATSPATNALDVSSGEGMTFDGLSLYSTEKDNPVKEIPVTYEAWIKLPKGYIDDAGTIYGNYRSAELGGVRFRLRTDGRPHIYYTGEASALSVNFYDVNVANGEWTHLTVVDDVKNGEMRCYVNGELAETVKMTAAQIAYKRDVSGMPMCIGGDFIAGTNNFKGQIRSVAIYTDVRTAEEISADMFAIDLTDEGLLSAYNLNGLQGEAVIEDATGRYDAINNRKTSDWAEPEEVADLEDFAYSMALLGDTQIIAGYYPEEFHHIIDWLIENKEEHKIAHVLNMGDITNFNYDREWDLAREQYFRLNGVIDYTLVRGDHDVLDDETADNGDDTTKYDRWFNVPEYTDRFNNSEDADYYQGENGSITNSYRAIEINGNKYLIVTMDKYPSEDVLTWIDAAVKKYPEHRVIMTMHCFITDNGEYMAGKNNPDKLIGADIWERIKGYENLEMVICGHEYAYGVVWTKAEGTNGNVVNNILANPQGPDFDREGATGMIAMLYFSEDGTDVQVRYYSPIIDRYFVGNNNEVTSDTYRLESSVFKIDTDTLGAATQITELKNVEFVESETTVYATADGSSVQVKYTTENSNGVQNGKITVKYDASLLSNPVITWGVTPETNNVIEGEGKLIISWTGATGARSTSGTLFTVDFDSKVTDSTPAFVDVNATNLSYTDEKVTYVLEGVQSAGTLIKTTETVTVTYKAGDDFEERMEYALELAKYSDVTFVMEAGFMASKSITVGNVDDIPEYTVYVKSSDTTAPIEIDTAGYNIILAGKYSFDYIKLTGNGSGASNSLFFPNSAKGVFGSNMTAGEKTANVTGADIEINSGSYYFVGALIDNTIGMTVQDAKVVLQGTAVADCVSGGSRLSGNVVGKSYVYIGGSASVTRYATASGYAASSMHDGEMLVNTTGTIGRLCAALGPLGSAGLTPEYTMTIKNVNCTTDCGFMSVRTIVKNKPIYANTNVIIDGGNFSKPCNGGLYVSGYVGTSVYGTHNVVINDGSFTATVYGGGSLSEVNTVSYADTSLIINGGEFTKYIYGGALLNAEGGVQAGNSLLELKGGTFGTGVQIFGGATLQSVNTEQSGNSTLNIYGGVTLQNYVSGGAQLWVNGTGYATEGGNGALVSGDVTFNIYDVDKDGNEATVTLNGTRLFASGYGNSSYAYVEMTGDTFFNFKGITTSSSTVIAGGLRAQGKNTRMSGDITGTLENVTLGSNFYGGSELVGANAKDTGDITITLKNTTFSKTVTAGPKITKATQTYTGTSILNYESGTLTGNVAGGCYFTVPNVKITGDSKLVFGTSSTAPTASNDSKIIGGCIADTTVFTTDGTTDEWGMYGSSDLIINSGTVASGAYIVGGSYLKTSGTPTATVDWDNYPVIGGVPGETNENHTKLTINGGTVNGPRLYAGSYCANGGQDHGEVILEVNGGTVIVTSACIDNYTSTTGYANIANKCIYPATFYPVNTKEITCDYTMTLNGGYFDTVADKTIGFAIFHGYNGVINGDTELNIAITTQNGKANTKYRINRVVAAINEPQADAVLIGDSTLNIYKSSTSTPYMYPGNPMTAGCYSSSVDKIDTDESDGIQYGFMQIGNVTMNVSAGTINRTTYVSGFRCNVDGSVTVNISDGKILKDVHGAGDSSTSYYSSVTGDVIWNISGGTFDEATNTYCGADAKSGVDYTKGYNVIGGNIYTEITGGTFNGVLHVAGNNSISEGKEARIKFIGDGYTLNTTVLPHGTVCGEYVGTYTIDLFRATKDVDTTGFAKDKVIAPFTEGVTVGTFTSEFLEVGTALNTLIPETVTIGDKTYTYAELIEFDAYSEYDNAFTFVEAETNEAVTEVAEGLTAVKVKVGERYSAPIVLTVKGVSVSGTVTTNETSVVKVQLIKKGETEAAYEVTVEPTEGSAAYLFDSVDEGTYTLKVISEGCAPYTEEITVAAENITKDVVLKAYDASKLDFLGTALALHENLSFNYWVDASIFGEEFDKESAYVTFEMGGRTFECTEYTEVLDGAVMIFAFSNISPQYMGDTVRATLKAKAVGDTTETIFAGPAYDYSIFEYCDSFFFDYENGGSPELDILLADLLYYGSESQKFANYNVNDLVFERLSDEKKACKTQTEAPLEYNYAETEGTVENATAVWLGAALDLQDAVVVQGFVQIAEEDVSDVKVVITDEAGETVLATVTSSDLMYYGESIYVANFRGFESTQMREKLNLTVYKGETQISETMTYSIESYAYLAQNDAPPLGTLVKAMMNYGDSAYNYANS